MTENEFITLYAQADQKTQKQVRELLEITPDAKESAKELLQILEKQDISPIIGESETSLAFEAVYNTKPQRLTACIDAFSLGVIYGKRQERAKKKACCR